MQLKHFLLLLSKVNRQINFVFIANKTSHTPNFTTQVIAGIVI
jgi:hypothetical protein